MAPVTFPLTFPGALNTPPAELDYLANYYVGRLKWLKSEIDRM